MGTPATHDVACYIKVSQKIFSGTTAWKETKQLMERHKAEQLHTNDQEDIIRA